jgi:hypothetical protein
MQIEPRLPPRRPRVEAPGYRRKGALWVPGDEGMQAGAAVALVGSHARSVSPPLPTTGLQGRWEFQGAYAAQSFTDAGSTPVASSGDLVYQVNDLSGGGTHLIQATSGARPVWRTNLGPGGDKNGLEFSASQYIRSTAQIVSSNSPCTTTYYLAIYITPGADSVCFARSVSTAAATEYLYYTAAGTAGDALRIDRGGAANLTGVLAQWPVSTTGVVAVVIDGTPASGSRIRRIYRDGVERNAHTTGTWAVSASLTASVMLNTYSGTGAGTYSGTIKVLGLLVYSVAHSVSEVAAVQRYFAATLGVAAPP